MTAKTLLGCSSSPWEPEASVLFSRMEVQPDYTRKTLINTFIINLKTSGIWNTLDQLWVMAAHTNQAARLNWIGDSQFDLLNNLSTFTVDTGFTGNGTTAYLTTNRSESAMANNRTQTSGTIGVYISNGASSADTIELGTIAGTGSGSFIATRTGVGEFTGRINSTTTYGASVPSPIGHSVFNRWPGDNTNRVFKNGVVVANSVITAAALNSSNVALLRHGSLYSSRTVSLAHYGAYMNTVQVANLNSYITTYLNGL